MKIKKRQLIKLSRWEVRALVIAATECKRDDWADLDRGVEKLLQSLSPINRAWVAVSVNRPDWALEP